VDGHNGECAYVLQDWSISRRHYLSDYWRCRSGESWIFWAVSSVSTLLNLLLAILLWPLLLFGVSFNLNLGI
jgi:hypothetical protein